MRTSVVIGVSGQDGWYLARLLRARGDRVMGVCRGEASDLPDGVEIRRIDVAREPEDLERLLAEARPRECFHLAAHHHPSSSSDPEDVDSYLRTNLGSVQTALGVLARQSPDTRFLHAASCRIFGHSPEPQSETSPVVPEDPYAIAKAAAHHLVRWYRSRGAWACSAILFNHESPRRRAGFVTADLARGAAEVTLGLREMVSVRDLGTRVDWGFAGDYAEAMVAILGAESPDDYVIATGELHTVEDVARIAFGRVGLDYRRHVRTDPDPAAHETRPIYRGDPTRIRERLGWRPKTSFPEIIESMVDYHLRALRSATRSG